MGCNAYRLEEEFGRTLCGYANGIRDIIEY